jgi:hypothetical protein
MKLIKNIHKRDNTQKVLFWRVLVSGRYHCTARNEPNVSQEYIAHICKQNYISEERGRKLSFCFCFFLIMKTRYVHRKHRATSDLYRVTTTRRPTCSSQPQSALVQGIVLRLKHFGLCLVYTYLTHAVSNAWRCCLKGCGYIYIYIYIYIHTFQNYV